MRAVTYVVFLLLAVAGAVIPMLDPAIRLQPPIAPMFLLQDLPVVPIMLIAALLFQPRAGRPAWHVGRRWPLWMAGAIVLFCWWGHYAILSAFDLSRDEQMADFDATIFASGHLFAVIPPAWRHFLPALGNLYILPVGGNVAWVSDYLPGNAALRALVGLVADRALTSPLLAGSGLLALHTITRRLWPESPGSRATALLCYAGSSQVLICGMSAFAMTAHLALDLVWLALFLRYDSRGTIGAIIVGFVATGLHQPLFHPLFALPFLLLEAKRDRRRFATYVVAYAAIAAFWMAWPHWVSRAAGPLPVDAITAKVDFFDRLRGLAGESPAKTLWLLIVNVLRFLVWQHPLLLPLALAGCSAARWRDPFVVALVVGILLPLVIVTILVPDAGYGWGYRYLHSVIGNACLLAGYGWRRFERAGMHVGRAMLAATLADLLLLVPAHGWMAHRMIEPAVEIDDRVRRTAADILVVDRVPLTVSTVINRADLSNRPLRLWSHRLSAADIATLCRRGSIAFADGDALSDAVHEMPETAVGRTTAHQIMLRSAAVSAGCAIRPFPAA